MMLRGIPADVSTTSTDGGVYLPMLLVVGTGCRRDPSANVYRHDATISTGSTNISRDTTQHHYRKR